MHVHWWNWNPRFTFYRDVKELFQLKSVLDATLKIELLQKSGGAFLDAVWKLGGSEGLWSAPLFVDSFAGQSSTLRDDHQHSEQHPKDFLDYRPLFAMVALKSPRNHDSKLTFDSERKQWRCQTREVKSKIKCAAYDLHSKMLETGSSETGWRLAAVNPALWWL